ncbi:dead deah box helicase domain-containing protein [Cyclospora cayetanensis]|uniref:ATP-dependent RNA helicase n=1 Tax=Cyclospora cayetanensis TaxID=88456 RepID=A0A1D3D1X7_9EIME|nr:dead deah box helicase domain-containing protein [Cyclospora cayetanensis]
MHSTAPVFLQQLNSVFAPSENGLAAVARLTRLLQLWGAAHCRKDDFVLPVLQQLVCVLQGRSPFEFREAAASEKRPAAVRSVLQHVPLETAAAAALAITRLGCTCSSASEQVQRTASQALALVFSAVEHRLRQLQHDQRKQQEQEQELQEQKHQEQEHQEQKQQEQKHQEQERQEQKHQEQEHQEQKHQEHQEQHQRQQRQLAVLPLLQLAAALCLWCCDRTVRVSQIQAANLLLTLLNPHKQVLEDLIVRSPPTSPRVTPPPAILTSSRNVLSIFSCCMRELLCIEAGALTPPAQEVLTLLRQGGVAALPLPLAAVKSCKQTAALAEVSAILQSMSVFPQGTLLQLREKLSEGPYSVPLAIESFPKTAVEVCGFTDFFRGESGESTGLLMPWRELRQRILQAKGWQVMTVSLEEWCALTDRRSREMYLRARLVDLQTTKQAPPSLRQREGGVRANRLILDISELAEPTTVPGLILPLVTYTSLQQKVVAGTLASQYTPNMRKEPEGIPGEEIANPRFEILLRRTQIRDSLLCLSEELWIVFFRTVMWVSVHLSNGYRGQRGRESFWLNTMFQDGLARCNGSADGVGVVESRMNSLMMKRPPGGAGAGGLSEVSSLAVLLQLRVLTLCIFLLVQLSPGKCFSPCRRSETMGEGGPPRPLTRDFLSCRNPLPTVLRGGPSSAFLRVPGLRMAQRGRSIGGVKNRVRAASRDAFVPRQAAAEIDASAPARPEQQQQEAFASAGFIPLGVLPSLRDSLKRWNISAASHIQAAALPLLLQGLSVCIAGETGSGKTVAYAGALAAAADGATGGAPPVAAASSYPVAVVLTPSRELAMQVLAWLRRLLHFVSSGALTPSAAGLLLGSSSASWPFGSSRRASSGRLSSSEEGSPKKRSCPLLLVSTPQAFAAAASREKGLFAATETLVLDEADMLLEGGFKKHTTALLERFRAADRESRRQGKPPTQYVLVAATLPSVGGRGSEGEGSLRAAQSAHSEVPESLHAAAAPACNTTPSREGRAYGGVKGSLQKLFPSMRFVESPLLHCHCSGLQQEFVAVSSEETEADRIDRVLGALRGPLRGLKTLVFCNTAATARRVAESLQERLQSDREAPKKPLVQLFSAQLPPLARAKLRKGLSPLTPPQCWFARMQQLVVCTWRDWELACSSTLPSPQ